MTDYDRDRGAYSPSGEAPLAFDARNPNGRGAGRPPTTLIISALILLVLVVALVLYYRSGVRHAGEPPVVGQPLSDIKQAPPASSQPTDEAAGLSIYGAEQAPAASSTAPRFAPAPEEPKPRPAPATPLRAESPAAPAPSEPTAQPAPRPSPPAIAPAPPAAAAAPVASAATGAGLLVQIGAFSSPSLADKGWNDVARLLPGEMVGRTKKVEPVAKDAQTLYRAYVGGFASKGEAAGFCGDLKAAGHSCLVK